MPGFDGTGPNGMGPMTGGARGFCVAQRGRYILPQPLYNTYANYGSYGFRPPASWMSREQEIDYLKEQAKMLQNDLKQLESEIAKLSAEKK